jgi:hypothetical protein
MAHELRPDERRRTDEVRKAAVGRPSLFRKSIGREGGASFSITQAQGFLNAVATASARHRTTRNYTQEVGPDGESGGSRLSVVAPGSYAEYEAALSRLTAAFIEAEGRQPTTDDDAFWAAQATLLRAFQAATTGELG